MTLRTCCLSILLLMALPVFSAEQTDGGRELFNQYQCWQCHGYEGQGGAAPRIALSGYPFAAFVRFVRFPTEMPAYTSELLPEDELRAIYDYLRAIPEPPALEDLPLLRDLAN